MRYNTAFKITDDRMKMDEAHLLERARCIAGFTLTELAAENHCTVPQDLMKHKGWVGHLIELALGAQSGSKPQPDFPELGIELKTLPVNAAGKPCESTFVCAISLLELSKETWETSLVLKKLRRVLWVPVQGSRDIPLADRRIGQAILWNLPDDLAQQLKQDWKEFTDLISLGELTSIKGSIGRYLQVRPKAADASALCWGRNSEGKKILTLPRGFYLRTRFTQKIIDESYAI